LARLRPGPWWIPAIRGAIAVTLGCWRADADGRAGLLLLSGVAADGPSQPWTAGVHAAAACVLLFRVVQERVGAPVTRHNSYS
jgi:hypothetical protein